MQFSTKLLRFRMNFLYWLISNRDLYNATRGILVEYILDDDWILLALSLNHSDMFTLAFNCGASKVQLS